MSFFMDVKFSVGLIIYLQTNDNEMKMCKRLVLQWILKLYEALFSI